MALRNFAAVLKEPSEETGQLFRIELQPFGEGLDAPITIELKEGATKKQAAELQSQLNLVGANIRTQTDQ